MFNLEKIKFVLVLVLVAALPFSETVKTICVYLAFIVMLLQLYRKEAALRLTLVHWGFVMLIVAALACSLFAEDQLKSLRGIRDILLYSTVYFVACSISDEKHIKTILWVFYISAAIAAVLGIIHVMQVGGRIEIHQLRNPNYIAMYMVIVLTSMVSMIIFSDKETGRSKVIIALLALSVLAAAILTVFRASFIGFILFAVAIFFAGGRARKLMPYAAAMLLIVLVSAFIYKPMWDKLMLTKSFFARLYLWEYALDLFTEHPLAGIGLDHYKGLIPRGVPDAGRTYYDAHNLYLNIAAQMGLFGLISLALIISGFVRGFFKANNLSGFGLALKYGALGGFLVIFTGGLFDTTLHHGHAVAFALLLGLFSAHVKPQEAE